VSADGSRVYWYAVGNLYLRDGADSVWVDESTGGGGVFQIASDSGSVAYFTKAGHLYRYGTVGGVSDLTPAGGVKGVLGASSDGSTVYYATASGIFRWREGTATQIAQGAAAVSAGDYPPATGTSRVSSDGSQLLFVATAALTPYENESEPEVYLYGPPHGGGVARMICVSCNPTGERPRAGASIPGAYSNGVGSGATDSYKPRVLTVDGSRVFFESAQGLQSQDSNEAADVYEWEASGVGGCARTNGCVSLLSSGRSPQGATFIDASADGDDVFFLTDSSLVANDPGSFDIYDARAGGGLPLPPTGIPCNGDACQALPEPPEDPTPGTLLPNAGNPPLSFPKEKKKRKKKHREHRAQAKNKHRRGGGSR
jgi:hypothetical protein